MELSKEQGRTEIYEKYDLSMSLSRRIYALMYVAWLIVEGLISAFRNFVNPQPPALAAHRMEYSIMYFIIAGLLLVLLHTYIARLIPRYFFWMIVCIHQMTFMALSLWTYACTGPVDQWERMVRSVFLFLCAFGQAGAFFSEIIESYTLVHSKRQAT